jgi:hypothetical protein
MGNKHFVRFIKYEETNERKTLDYLRKKTIWFSKPYALNDYFEMGYIHPTLEHGEANEALLNKYLSDPDLRNTLLAELPKLIYVKSFIDKLMEDINNNEVLDDDQKTAILELLAYENVGICCFSDILVLTDNSASIMFAHYADRLSGLALIYEISAPNIRKVEYLQSNKRPPSGGLATRIENWADGDYENEYEDFIHKSEKWAYEAEYRLLGRPGVHNASDYGVSLKAILYTPRLGGNIKTGDKIRRELDEINARFYENELKIIEIGPSAPKYMFQLTDDSGQYLGEWVKENFLDLYSPDDWKVMTNARSEALFENHLHRFYGYETEELKEDILNLRQFIAQGRINEQLFFGMRNEKTDVCFFNIRKQRKPNAVQDEDMVFMIDDFYINNLRKWAIAEKLFEMLKSFAHGIPVYVQIPGEDEMTRRFLRSRDGIRILEIYKL